MDKKNILSVLSFLLLCIGTCSAKGTVKTIMLSYDESDFIKEYDANGAMYINSFSLNSSFDMDVREPALPHVSVYVAIDSDTEFSELSYSMEQHEILSNIMMAPNPRLMTTNQIPEVLNDEKVQFAEQIYPLRNVIYAGTQATDGIKIICIKVCPYIYNAKTKNLSFASSFVVNINLKESANRCRETTNVRKVTAATAEFLRSMVINPDAITLNEENIKNTSGVSLRSTSSDQIDYVIITSQALASAFQPLADWKTMKGVRTRVITTEEIYNTYPGSTQQLKIKQCLQDYHNNHGMQYALLGGDDSIVPVQQCIGEVLAMWPSFGYTTVRNILPTDLFYSNFQYSFDWDNNGNNIIGEVEDSVQLFPDIYLTRLPISSSGQVTSCIEKILKYEKNPPVSYWNNKILMLGRQFSPQLVFQYDAEQRGNYLYTNYIQPYWNGYRVRFYDSVSDVESGTTALTASNLQLEFAKGYPFIECISHGVKSGWITNDDELYYTTNDASNLHNYHPSLVTTTACFTNSFDDSNPLNPCLSESFIWSANSVVAYLGCSREAFSNRYGVGGASESFEGLFYKSLFSDQLLWKNFGKVVALAKAEKIVDCSAYGADRWVMFGLNPIGDPEMPVFVNQPIHISPMSYDYLGGCLYLSDMGAYSPTGIRMCAIDEDTNGNNYYQVYSNQTVAEFSNIPNSTQVCITMPGYVPLLFHHSSQYILQNKTFANDSQYVANEIRIGSNVSNSTSQGPVTLEKDTKTYLNANETIIVNDFEVKKGAELLIGF